MMAMSRSLVLQNGHDLIQCIRPYWQQNITAITDHFYSVRGDPVVDAVFRDAVSEKADYK